MPALKEFYFDSSTGKDKVYTRMWLPDNNVKATIQLAHGIAEYIDRYDDFMQFLAVNGFVAIGNDHLGHGRTMGDISSQGFFADENGWDFVVKDMKTLYDKTATLFPGVPRIIFGHSMGSFLTRTYIIMYPNDFNAVVISGTGNQTKPVVLGGCLMSEITVKMRGPRYVSHLLNNAAFGNYNKDFHAMPGETAWLSANKENVRKYDADPLCGFIPTCSVFRDMMKGIKFITDKNNTSKMNKDVPILFLSGANDPVGEKGKGVERAYKLFIDSGMKDVYMHLYEGGRHEMLNEIEHEVVYNDILDWLNGKQIF